MADDRDDDRLLRDLAALAREEEAREQALLDPRWDRLAHGALSAEELTALDARTLEIAGETERRVAAFDPLPEEFRARVATRILEELKGSAAPSAGARALRTELPPRRHRAWRWRLMAAAAALVGVAVLVPRLLPPPFPAYEFALLPQGEATERSLEPASTPEPALFHPGTAFEVAVRPLEAIDDPDGTLEVRCLLQDGAHIQPWPSCAARAEIAPTRAVRIAGTLAEGLTLEPGTWTLWIVLGRAGEIPNLERQPALLQGESVATRSWIALAVPRPLRLEALP